MCMIWYKICIHKHYSELTIICKIVQLSRNQESSCKLFLDRWFWAQVSGFLEIFLQPAFHDNCSNLKGHLPIVIEVRYSCSKLPNLEKRNTLRILYSCIILCTGQLLDKNNFKGCVSVTLYLNIWFYKFVKICLAEIWPMAVFNQGLSWLVMKS